jgi:hypothetical protein
VPFPRNGSGLSLLMRPSCSSLLRLALVFAGAHGIVSLGAGFSPISARATEAAPRSIGFNREIRPLLTSHCISCHGPDAEQRKGGLRLDLREEALKRQESGSRAIVPGDPEASELVVRLESGDRDEVMPPPKTHKTLTPGQKGLLRRWIREGAVYEPHWAFVPPKRPQVPGGAAGHPVDAFIQDALRVQALDPSPEADRATLLRRVTLDLTGLPPSEEELSAFLADGRSDAYERVVDRLMASRAYAERRAQDWLDLARYSDTCGFADDQKQDIWPYRDWVVEALHRNMPYDQFTIEQLAGDMLPGATEAQRIATGFHRNAPQAKGATYPVEEYRLKGVADRVNTTGRVWFGLTLGCAECHDHKFDPIAQKDYYALFAIFNNVVHLGAGFTQGGPVLEKPTPEQSEAVERLQRQLDLVVKAPGAPKEGGGEKEAIERELQKVRSAILAIPVMQELARPRETFVHIRGDFMQRGEAVQGAPPRMFLEKGEAVPANRLEFARWLVSGRHPLVARVAVNRFWQEHFGEGLVRTPDDFGLHGALPSHPELLDWLACEFVESGWDMKRLHRLIVTSATYRQQSRVSEEHLRRDPQNVWLARAPRPRLAAESLRDQALAVSGLLNREEGGPPVFPVQPAGYWEQRGLKGVWKNSEGPQAYRRTLYTYWRRMALHPSLELLDAPARAICVARRPVSNVPTQALVLLNDPLFFEAATALADELLRAFPSDSTLRLQAAFERTLSRPPTAAERTRSEEFLAASAASSPEAGERHRWVLMANVLLNLDETLVRP